MRVQFCNSSWFREGVFNCPSPLKAFVDREVPQSRASAPVIQTHRLVVVCEIVVAFLISSLIFVGCPMTVVRGVVTVIVFPINLVDICRLLAHISQEVDESILSQPSFANGNTSASITMEADIARVVYALLHIGPRSVGLGFTKTVSPVAAISLYSLFGQGVNLLQQGLALAGLAHRINGARATFIVTREAHA